jgi:lipid-binding SYLF domain-containing protein
MFKKARHLVVGSLVFLLLFGLHTTGFAASAVELNAQADASLKVFYDKVSAAQELTQKAQGMLIFPAVYKAGFGVGAEYGEGVLRIGGTTVDYYSTASASIGFQLGAQKKSIILLFMTKDSLTKFRASQGWEVGVDGSVALVEYGVGKDFDTTNIKDPIIGFVFGNKGLMYNLSLEGSKLTKIKR